MAESSGTAALALVRRLFAHLAWADDRALASLRSQADPHPRALALMAHVLGAEETWLARIQGRVARTKIWPELSLDDCEATVRDLRAGWAAALDALGDDAALARPVAYRNSAGDAFTSRLEDILLQVATHGSYHRGQVALLVRDSGDVPSPTDYIAFARGAAAATRPPESALAAAGVTGTAR